MCDIMCKVFPYPVHKQPCVPNCMHVTVHTHNYIFCCLQARKEVRCQQPMADLSTPSASPLHSHCESSTPTLLSESLQCVGDDLSTPSASPSHSHCGSSTPTLQCVGDYHGVSHGGLSTTPDTPYTDHSFTDPNDTDYELDTPGRRRSGEMRGGITPFLTTGTQLEKFVSHINQTSKCMAYSCNGKLVLKNLELVGKGGDGEAYFVCSGGCGERDISLPCSNSYKTSSQTELSVALQVAFLCSGANYSMYENVLGILGMHPVSNKQFYNTIKMLYDPVKQMLDEQCELAKQEMKDAPPEQIGSWERAVTSW